VANASKCTRMHHVQSFSANIFQGRPILLSPHYGTGLPTPAVNRPFISSGWRRTPRRNSWYSCIIAVSYVTLCRTRNGFYYEKVNKCHQLQARSPNLISRPHPYWSYCFLLSNTIFIQSIEVECGK